MASLCNFPTFAFPPFPFPGLPGFPSISLSIPFPAIAFAMPGCPLD